MARQLSPFAAAKLKQWEGLRLIAYPDGNQWGIGYGHTAADVHEGLVWTEAQADESFVKDTTWACADVERLVTVDLNDNQFGALTAFCYNVGTTGFTESSVLTLVNKRASIDKIQAALLLWDNKRVNGKLVHNDGLANRRNMEGALFGAGQFVASGNVAPSVPPAWYQTPKVRTLIASGAGISGTALTTAATQAQGLAQYSHIFVWSFIGLSIAGIVVGILQHRPE